jgi:hypothetical protein
MLDIVRVRYSQPIDVDVDLKTGRVVGIRPPLGPEPDLGVPSIVLDESYEFRGPAAPELQEAAFAAVRDQVIVVDVDLGRFAVEVVPEP